MSRHYRSRPKTTVWTVLIALALAPGAAAAARSTTFVAAEAADGDLFGAAVDTGDGLLAVGAYSTDLERADVGVVHLFEPGSDGVAQIATLAAADGELGGRFGAAVAISGDVVLVGAPGVILSELNEGAAYLFERADDAWTRVAELRRESPGRNDMAGAAVALDAGVAVVGAPGADAAGTDSGVALVYERRSGSWERVATLVPETETGGARFGSAVAVDGDRILVGASGDVQAAQNPGSAHLFERTGAGWSEVATLTPSDGAGGDAFGDAVALADDRALIGARFADQSGSDEGAAYVFERTTGGWNEIARLTAPQPADRDQFGHAVALAGDAALVGAPRVDDPGRDAGAVWEFVSGANGWGMSRRLSPEAPETYDEFGSAVAAQGSFAVVGAPQDIPADATGETVTGTATLFRDVGQSAPE